MLTWGCEREEIPSATWEIRDSAGVSIVENHGEAPPDGGGWSLAAEPRVEVGGLKGGEEDQLFRVRGATTLRDGRIAVGNSGSSQVRIYDRDGRHLTSLGGPGEGPGESQSLDLVGLHAGDTLVVLDRRLRRISFFLPDSGFIRSVGINPGEVYLLQARGLFGDGSVMVEGMVFADDDPQGYARRPVAYRVLALDGSLEADLGEFPGSETMLVTRQSDHGIVDVLEDIPFGKEARVAVRSDGFYYGSQDRYEVKSYDQTGGLARVIRLARPPRAVTETDLNQFFDREVEGAADENEARELRQRFEEAPVPPFHPAYANLHSDAEGFLFVEEYRLPGDPWSALTVFDPEGKLAGRLDLPEELEILEVGWDYLLGLHRDELDVEYIRVYEMTRPGR
jgi:hypothetical protein